jgi:VWFA-related protein
MLVPLAGILALAAPDEATTRIPLEGYQEAVEVNAVEYVLLAQDRDGQPVDDLSSEDIAVTFGDEEVPFRLLDPEPDPGAGDRQTTLRLTLQLGNREMEAVSSSTAPRYYVLFLDLGSDVVRKASLAADAVAAFVEETIRPHDFVAVTAFNGSLILEQAFHPGAEEAVKAVRRAYARPRAQGPRARQQIQGLIARIRSCEFVPDNPYEEGETSAHGRSLVDGGQILEEGCVQDVAAGFIDQWAKQAVQYLASLEGAIRLAGGVRGSATLIGVTHGANVEPERVFREAAIGVGGARQIEFFQDRGSSAESTRLALEQLRKLAAEERVTLFFVDPSRAQGGSHGARQGSFLLDDSSPVALAHTLPQGTLYKLSSVTGGATIRQEELLDGLRRLRALEASRRRLVVYTPRSPDAERSPSVRIVPRRNGITINHDRAGAAGPAALVSSASVDFGRAHLLEERGEIYLPFVLGASHADLGYRHGADGMVADLTLYVSVEDADGRHLASSYHYFRSTFTEEQWEVWQDRSLNVRGWLETSPGSYRISALVRNVRTGQGGAVVRKLRLAGAGP